MIDSALRNLVTRIYPLPDEELEALQQCFEPASIEKKGFILKEGQLTQQLFFIKSGVFRGYFVKDIEEITLNFYFGPTFYAEIVSIHDKAPTKFNIQALEAGEVWTGDIRQVEQLGRQYPALLTLFIRFYENVLAFGQKRQLSSIFESAEERYLKLFNERPKVIERIPLVYIASYLGIKPESLSRIRNKIARK